MKPNYNPLTGCRGVLPEQWPSCDGAAPSLLCPSSNPGSAAPHFISDAMAAVGRDWAQRDSRVQNHFPKLKANGSNPLDMDDYLKAHGWDFALHYKPVAFGLIGVLRIL